MVRLPLLLCLLAWGVCEGSPARHRRPAKFFRTSTNTYQEESPNVKSGQHSSAESGLLDLSGVYAGTWTRLDEPADAGTGSSSVGAADKLASRNSNIDVTEHVLLSSGSGRLTLRLNAGPTATGEELAGIEGALHLSKGSLVFGPGVRHLKLSGITQRNSGGEQTLHAVLKPQHPVFGYEVSTDGRLQPPVDDLTVPSSTFIGGWIRGRQQRQQQRRQHHQLGLTKQQEWLRGHRAPLMGMLRARKHKAAAELSGTASDTPRGSFSDTSGTSSDTQLEETEIGRYEAVYGVDSSSGWDQQRGLKGHGEAPSVRCRFRLEVTVTPGESTGQVAAGDTAAPALLEGSTGTRSIKAAAPDSQKPTEPQVQQKQQQQQDDADDDDQLDPGDQQLDLGDGEVVSDDTAASLSAVYSMRWNQAIGLAGMLQQTQQQHVLLEEASYRNLGSMTLSDQQTDPVAAIMPGPAAVLAENTLAGSVHNVATAAAAAAATAALAAAATELAAAGVEGARNAPHPADAAAGEGESDSADDAAAWDEESQLPPVDSEAAAAMGSGIGSQSLRKLNSRDFPGLHTAPAPATGQLSEQPPAALTATHAEDAIAEEDLQPAAAAAGPPVDQHKPEAAAPPAASVDTGTSPVPQSLIDYWMLPCSHSHQWHHARCHQLYQQQQWQQRLIIQGLLLSDNCNASWSITAVALPPGGLERQAMCYAIIALLLCLAQVVLLRKQARGAHSSPAAALKLSLLGVCAGSQLDACLSMAHLAAALAAPDISLPLLVVAAAQFALFAGADMTLMLHVWRAHNSHSRRQQQRHQQPHTLPQAQQHHDPFDSTGLDTAAPAGAVAGAPSNMTAAVLARLPQQWSAAVAAVAAAVVAQLQDQAEGLREFTASSSGSGVMDVLLSGLVQLMTGHSLLLLYVRFYLVLLAVTLISWVLATQVPFLLILAFSFWIPQIMYNIQHSTRQALRPTYILAASAARLLLPLYLLFCPGNMLQLAPQPWLGAGLLVWMGLQVIVLLLQHCIGPHVLLPAAWVPERYNYHRLELPWQFKQRIAELQKLGHTPQHQQQLPRTAGAAAAQGCCLSQPPQCGGDSWSCDCGGLQQPGSYSSSFASYQPNVAPAPACTTPVTSWQQQQQQQQQHYLHSASGLASPSSGSCCCRYRPAPGTSQQHAAGRHESDTSGSSCWGSFSGDSSSTSDCELGGQHHPTARSSWPAVQVGSIPAHYSSGNRQLQWQQWYPEISPSSDAYYISMLADSTAGSTSWHTQHQQLPLQPFSYLENMQRPTQQHHSCGYHSLHPQHQMLPVTSLGSPPAVYHNNTALASTSSNSGAMTQCTDKSSHTRQSYQPWCQTDDSFHDVAEGYDAVTGQGVVECVICMTALTLLPLSGRCVTPCGHFFHPECLANWMEVKAECPTCRGPLPPL